MNESDPVERVKQSDGDRVLDVHARIGARPSGRYVGGAWDMASLTYVRTPDCGEPDDRSETGPPSQNTQVHAVDLAPEDVTDAELRDMAEHAKYQGQGRRVCRRGRDYRRG